jgi:phage FluMu protein Com
MQLQCSHCHRPFALNNAGVQIALDQVFAQDLSHYNVQCPHCRRVNFVSKKQLQRAMPNYIPGEHAQAESAEAESARNEAGDG